MVGLTNKPRKTYYIRVGAARRSKVLCICMGWTTKTNIKSRTKAKAISNTPHGRGHITGYAKLFCLFYVDITGSGRPAFQKSRIPNRLHLKINLQNTGHVLGCHMLLPVLAKCYQKMTSQDRLLQAKTSEKVNEITGFKGQNGSPPLNHNRFWASYKKSALVASVNEKITLPVTSHTGWYGSAKVAQKDCRLYTTSYDVDIVPSVYYL